MRRIVAVGIGLVVLAVALFAWRGCGSSSKPAGTSAGSGVHAGGFAIKHGKDAGPTQPASLAGKVTRASDGAPVPNATVSLAPAELMAMFIKSEMPTLVAVTDASGNWKVPRVMPGAYVVAATASGYLPGDGGKVTVASGEQRDGVDLTLTAGGTIVHGTVADVGGGPIGEARVTATKGDDMPDLSGHADLVTATKADGTYELTLPDGSFRIEASHDDYTHVQKRIELAGKPITVDFSLIPGAVIRGQVVARDGGKPVPGALVRAEGGHGDRGDGATAMADENGNFQLRSLGSGTLELKALGHGYASANPTVVSVGIGEQVDGIRVLVDRAYSISGKVVRKGKPDEPLPGITLGAFSIAAKAFGIALEPSAKDGSFEIVGLKPAQYMLFAVGEGSVPEIGKNVEIVDKDVEGVVVEVGTGVTVAGRVEPPMAGAAMTVEMAGQVGFANMFDAAKLMLVHGETDASGAFTLKNVPSGAFKVKAMAPSGHAGEQPLVVAEADISGVVVKLDPRASVSGRVVDSNGAPVAGGRVNVDSLEEKNFQMSFGGGDRSRATTAPDGTFKVVGLEPGKVRVRAASDDDEFTFYMAKKTEPTKSAAELTLVAGKDTPNIVLTVEARDGTIRGTVMTNDGKPAPDAWVTAQRVIEKDPNMPDRAMRWMGGNHPPVLTGSDGQFVITKLRKGTYNLSVEGPKGTSHAEKEGVKLGENVTITLAQLGTLAGKVTLQGAPVATFDIECHSPKDDEEKHVDDKTGAYFIDRLTPGSYKCNIDSDKGTATATVEIGAGPTTLDFKLTGWATVTGIVVNVLTKQPVAGVTAFAGTEGAWSSRNMNDVMTGHIPTTDATGHFVVERVAVGKGKVAIMPKDSFQPLGTRDYTAAESQRVDVGTIEIIPPRNGDAGTYGMTTMPEADKLMIVAVRDDGPAAAAGVKIGDRILSINGRDVAQLTPMVASQLIASGSIGIGETVQLSLDRAGAKVEATVTSVKW